MGILSFPHHFATLGIWAGLAIITFASLACTLTLHFLSRLASNTDLTSFFALGKLAFGQAGQVSAMIAVILFIFGALIFYLVVAADNLIGFLTFVRPGAVDVWYASHASVMILIALLTLPIACLRDMSALGKASIAGMVCMAYILVLTVGDWAFKTPSATAPLVVSFGIDTFSRTFSSLLFSFVNHLTVVSVIPALIDPTPARRFKATVYPAATIYLFYVLIGVCGYLHFGQEVSNSILESSSDSGALTQWAYVIGKLMMSAVLILSYPLLVDPCRGTLEGALGLFFDGKNWWKRTTALRSLIITFFIVLISLLIGIFYADAAEEILGATTALSGSLIVFIFPAAYFLKMSHRYKAHWWEFAVAYFCIVFGFYFMVSGTFFSVKKIILSRAGTA